MKTALFIGLGSIGKRHLRVLRSLGNFNVIALRSKPAAPGTVSQEEGIKNVYSLEEALYSYPDFAIVSNPTSLHVLTCLQLLAEKIPVLLEKPIAIDIEGGKALLNASEAFRTPVLVGYQLRHHPGFMLAKETLDSGELGRALHFLGYVGQYLPDWRPTQDYTKSYSAKPEMGGGVLLDLSHEIDIARALMGPVSTVACLCGRVSNLDIESDDCADLLLAHNHSQTSIHLDYLSREYTWYSVISCERGVICWDYGEGFVSIVKAGSEVRRWVCPPEFDRDALFCAQMRHFLEVVDHTRLPMVSLSDGLATLELVIAAGNSQATGKHVALERGAK